MYRDTDEMPLQMERRAGLECEDALRGAAATLCHASPAEVGVTTVVCSVADGFGSLASAKQL
jgi:hypothetical protein